MVGLTAPENNEEKICLETGQQGNRQDMKTEETFR